MHVCTHLYSWRSAIFNTIVRRSWWRSEIRNYRKQKTVVESKPEVDESKQTLSVISQMYLNTHKDSYDSNNIANNLEGNEGNENRIIQRTNNTIYKKSLWMDSTYLRYSKKLKMRRRKMTGDISIPISDVTCTGCGILLHSQDHNMPGFIPLDQFKNSSTEDLKKTVCQRCRVMQMYDIALNVNVPQEAYYTVLSQIKLERALVIILVDLLDPSNTLTSEFSKFISPKQPIYIVGNKIDLIPKDDTGYMERIKENLMKYAGNVGLENIRGVHLISAKTEYGVEDFVSNLMSNWSKRGHMYLLGCANSGKSTLFNALVSSDLCMSQVSDLIQKATISIWPGTTLNFLKFPLTNPSPLRMHHRFSRIKQDSKIVQEEEKLRKLRVKWYRGRIAHATLRGTVGATFKEEKEFKPHEISTYSFDENSEEVTMEPAYVNKPTGHKQVFEESMLPDPKRSRWFYDTPGLMSDSQVVNKLSQDDIERLVPKKLVLPRTYRLWPNETIFISGLSRVDYTQGDTYIYITVLAANNIPTHICPHDEADSYYLHHFGMDSLLVPQGTDAYLNSIPSLVGKEISLTGIGLKECCADVQLSSAGWVAVTVGDKMSIKLRCYTPSGHGCTVRQPPLLKYIVNVKGKRRGTRYYDMKSAKFMM